MGHSAVFSLQDREEGVTSEPTHGVRLHVHQAVQDPSDGKVLEAEQTLRAGVNINHQVFWRTVVVKKKEKKKKSCCFSLFTQTSAPPDVVLWSCVLLTCWTRTHEYEVRQLGGAPAQGAESGPNPLRCA